MQDTPLLTLLARLAWLPFRLSARSAFAPPRKALILQPCCLSRAMQTTPLLAALSETYPQARFDWALHRDAQPAVATNPRLTELIDTGNVLLPAGRWRDVRALIERMRTEQYDTVFVPRSSSVLAFIAWRAGIGQRVGLSAGGRGFSHTMAVKAPSDEQNEGAIALSLARALGIEATVQAEYYPRDEDRTAVTELLVEEVDWPERRPLVVMHPGGGDDPLAPDERKRWPVERFALLANHLVREHGAVVLLVGQEAEQDAAQATAGLSSAPVLNLAGRLDLGRLGALCEVVDLYVGNDAGPTHVAAAMGCATLAIFGPTDPARRAPFAVKGPVVTLGGAFDDPFSWDNAVPAGDAITAADRLLGQETEPAATPTPSAEEQPPNAAG